jgi:flagellar FliJ protein
VKREPFRLAPVLRLRRTQERVAALAAAQAAGAAHAAARDVQEQEAALHAAAAPPPGAAAAFLVAVTRNRMAAEGAALARDVAIAKAEHAELIRGRWTEAAQKAKGLERLEERHLAALQRADDMDEVRTVDDIVTRQHADRRQTATPPHDGDTSEEEPWSR